MIRTQIIMLRILRMRGIFVPLILIFERNKIFFITEFIYYKFSVIIIFFFFFFYWFFETWLFLPILLFLLGQPRLIGSLSFNFGIINGLQQFNRYKKTTFCHLFYTSKTSQLLLLRDRLQIVWLVEVLSWFYEDDLAFISFETIFSRVPWDDEPVSNLQLHWIQSDWLIKFRVWAMIE